MIHEHVQMDTKTSCSLPHKHGLSDGANAQKHVIYHSYILKFFVKLLFMQVLWTNGVHMNILKLQQHLCGLYRIKSEISRELG